MAVSPSRRTSRRSSGHVTHVTHVTHATHVTHVTHVTQALFWTWEAEWLDDAFESCLCELLVAVEEDLSNFTHAMGAFSAALGSGDEPGARLP